MSAKTICITDLTISQTGQLVADLGEPGYRAQQLLRWIYKGLAQSYDEMADLPALFRRKLAESTRLSCLESEQQVAGRDGSIKTLFRLADDATIESTLMGYPAPGGKSRYTVCISTQVGCAIGCPFCATGQQGFVRNLTAGEIIDQVLYFARYLKDSGDDTITNLVFMGMGEPLANYDNLWQAITMLNSPQGFGLGARNMTISTAGLIPGIQRLCQDKLQVGLAISLHAAKDDLRNQLVPLNRKYPLAELIAACREYFAATGRRVSFEYVLFEGVNDQLPQARQLVHLLEGLNCHVNLIAANPTTSRNYRPPAKEVIQAFADELKRLHIVCTVRQSKGAAIAAGCGQLRSRFTRTVGKKKPVVL